MKRALLFFCAFLFFVFSWFNRYRPVSLDVVSPTIKSVEIKGEVNEPGIYDVKWEATINDVINASGGLKENADIDSISLNEIVENNAVIVIPENQNEKKRISINSASLEQLTTLPGIGPAIAQRIIDYRSQTSFHTLEDIKNVKGIGDALFNKIKDMIIL